MKKHHLNPEGNQATAPGAEATGRLSRRAFVLRGSAAATLGTALSGLPLVLGDEASSGSGFTTFSEKQKKMLAAVQEHLFPKGADSPGAQEINALPFLQFVIAQTDFNADSRNFILNSIQSLEEASMERFDLAFEELDFSRKERLLRYLADRTRWGKNWLSLLLYYILEALLADPVYGSNPDGIGWQWLEHQPGFPRPPPDKIYPRITARR
jgi:gluconate 2-dehydrogenase gamma chain